MSSTAACVGIGEDGAKSSSRILKPPGGGHSDIFGPPQEAHRPQRPKNDQQNSDMMNEIMGKATAPPSTAERSAPQPSEEPKSFFPSEQKKEPASTRGRVPPGGFSSGLW